MARLRPGLEQSPRTRRHFFVDERSPSTTRAVAFRPWRDTVSRRTTSTVSPGTSIGSQGAREPVKIGSILAESKSTQTFVTSTGRRSGSNPRSERKPSYAASASMVRAKNEQPQNRNEVDRALLVSRMVGSPPHSRATDNRYISNPCVRWNCRSSSGRSPRITSVRTMSSRNQWPNGKSLSTSCAVTHCNAECS